MCIVIGKGSGFLSVAIGKGSGYIQRGELLLEGKMHDAIEFSPSL